MTSRPRTWRSTSTVAPSTPAEKGYPGAGSRVHTPLKGRNLGAGNRAYNMLLTGIRAIGERAAALLTQRWTAPRHITLSPSRTGAIVAGALVLTTLERETR